MEVVLRPTNDLFLQEVVFPAFELGVVDSAPAIDHLLQARTRFGVRIPLSSRTWRGSPGYAGSDHYALTSDFELRPAP